MKDTPAALVARDLWPHLQADQFAHPERQKAWAERVALVDAVLAYVKKRAEEEVLTSDAGKRALLVVAEALGDLGNRRLTGIEAADLALSLGVAGIADRDEDPPALPPPPATGPLAVVHRIEDRRKDKR